MSANSAIPGASTVRPSSASLSSSRGWGLISPPRPSSRSGSARATMPVCVDVWHAGRGQALQALESVRHEVVDSLGCFLHWAPTRTGPRRRVHAQSGLERSSTSDQQNERRGAHRGSSIDRCESDSLTAVQKSREPAVSKSGRSCRPSDRKTLASQKQSSRALFCAQESQALLR